VALLVMEFEPWLFVCDAVALVSRKVHLCRQGSLLDARQAARQQLDVRQTGDEHRAWRRAHVPARCAQLEIRQAVRACAGLRSIIASLRRNRNQRGRTPLHRAEAWSAATSENPSSWTGANGSGRIDAHERPLVPGISARDAKNGFGGDAQGRFQLHAATAPRECMTYLPHSRALKSALKLMTVSTEAAPSPASRGRADSNSSHDGGRVAMPLI
jgi:hypothetical protein